MPDKVIYREQDNFDNKKHYLEKEHFNLIYFSSNLFFLIIVNEN